MEDITYMPPPSKASEEEGISADVTKDHSLEMENKIESAYSPEKASTVPADRDKGLARIETDKRLSLIKAWEDNNKSKAENKAQKKTSSILSWENTERAAIEAKLRKKEEELERKKAEYAEKMQNKMAKIHKEAEMKRAAIEAQRGKAFVEAEEKATKYHATGAIPKKNPWFFGAST